MARAGVLAEEGLESSLSAVSWAAIFAGAASAAVLFLILIVIGTGIGLAFVSPWQSSGASATTMGILAIAWSLAVPLFSYAVGGYLAGRLRTQWVGVHSDEVFFRDTAHGMLVWAVGTLFSAFLLGTVLSWVVHGAAQAGATAATVASSAVVSSADDATGNGWSPYFTDMLFRMPQQQAQGNDTAAKAEIGRIAARSLAAGQLSDEDKNYAAQLIAHQTGLSQSDAAKRIDDVVAAAKQTAAQAAEKAKAGAEVARKAGVYATLWGFVALLIGGLSASYMATVGGRIRDGLPAL
ncbi:hypothetical protein FZC33_00680 [Labrys sp. KNU-23]|uniref:hypothetical protein n=1 Tax=Labrys sp. KNU-23 TaxID=2789216 RepID=UPI0011EE6C1E|nr:hypothetical protein [Labrys sp. KNU-23]QEN84834.1 hypothetical protein FZC33_00680 [Labrys sp. KNU-23]